MRVSTGERRRRGSRRFGWVAAIGLAACAPNGSTGKDTSGSSPDAAAADGATTASVPTTTSEPSTGDTGLPPCEPIVSMSPANGAIDAYYRAPIRIELPTADATAALAVLDPDGNVIPGVTTVEDTEVTWVGDPLAPSTAYAVELTRACGADAFGFETSDVGTPVAVDLTGRTYALDPTSGRWLEPPGAGPLFAAVLGTTRLLVAVTDAQPDALDLVAAVGMDGVQNTCTPTMPIDATWADPYFEAMADAIVLQTSSFGLQISDFALTGSFASDGSAIAGATFSGLADTRALGAEFGLGDTPDAVCQLVAVFFVYCTACPDGEPLCLDMRIEGVEAPETELPVVERSPA